VAPRGGAALGLILQHHHLPAMLTAHEAVSLPLQARGLDRSQVAQRSDHVLGALGLADHTRQLIYELSGGQRQRVAIAAALALEPDVLVADEPVSMLDVSVRAGVLNVLDGLRRDGLAILMITHDLSTAARFAQRIAVMYLGRIVEEGPASAVVRNPQHPYTKALLSVVPRRDPRDRRQPQILQGETPDAVAIPSGCRFHPRCPVAIEQCAVEDPTLTRPVSAEAGHRAACVLLGSRPAG
jgi:oligopeptide/dipeptide ABC transporter ATP-binding protein